MSVISQTPRASGELRPLCPLPGLFPGHFDDLKQSPDPKPTTPPNHKSCICPCFIRGRNCTPVTSTLVRPWVFDALVFLVFCVVFCFVYSLGYFCVFTQCLVWPVSPGYQFLIVLSVFSNVYLRRSL